MSAKTYALNPDHARETDGNFSKIDLTGAYTGYFTLACHLVAHSGATGIQFNFESKEGQQANNLTLYTANAKGEAIFGEKQLYALMACVQQRSIQPKTEIVEVYDYDTRGLVKKSLEIYPTLMNILVGVVLQREEYLNNNNEIKHRMNVVRFFNAKTRKTASEILDKVVEAKTLDALLLTLKDKNLSAAQKAPSHAMPAHSVDADFDDNIPF